MSNVDLPQSIAITDQAYHGTSCEAAQSIITEGWKKSVGIDQLLGEGVYFFEGNQAMARHWARDRFGVPFSILQSTVQFGLCLNLLDSDHGKLVEEMAENLKRCGVADVTVAVAINALADVAQIDTVRATRTRKTKHFLLSGPLEWGTELLLCVKNLAKIDSTRIISTSIPV